MNSLEPLNFYSLHKFLGNASSNHNIYIWQSEVPDGRRRYEVKIVDYGLCAPKVRFTIDIFFKIFQDHAPDSVLLQIQDLKERVVNLSVGQARKFYKECVIEELDFLHEIVALNPLYEEVRVVWNDEFPKALPRDCSINYILENKATFKKFKSYLAAIYGLEKLKRTCVNYEIDLQTLHEEGADLTVDLIHELTIGLNDIDIEDLEEFLQEVKALVALHKDHQLAMILLKLSRLPQRMLIGMQKELDVLVDNSIDSIKTLMDKLSDLFEDAKDLSSLTKASFNFLINSLRPTLRHQDIPFSGHKIEGVVNSQKAMLQHTFIYCRWYDDQERLQLYNDIIQMERHLPRMQIEQAFDELFSKSLVKKEMQEGSLVPAPLEEGGIGWYVVNKRVIDEGKFFYFLTEASSSFNLPDRLEYRSTSADPATLDSLNTVIADLSLTAPGYHCKENSKLIELEILLKNSKKPLKINGHSLGGTLAQLVIINLIEHLTAFQDIQLVRNIDVSFFDAPAIGKEDALEFAIWVEENREIASKISLRGYISREDFVAGTGTYHLGNSVNKECLKAFSFKLLMPTKRGALSKPELDLHPHTQFFYSNEKYIDFVEEESSIESFDAEQWRKPIEAVRHVAGTYIAPVLKVGGRIKNFFLGSRLHESGISYYMKSLFSKYSI